MVSALDVRPAIRKLRLLNSHKSASVRRSDSVSFPAGGDRPMRSTHKFLRHAIELRSEFFHGCIFAGNFTSLSTVQSDLCGD